MSPLPTGRADRSLPILRRALLPVVWNLGLPALMVTAASAEIEWSGFVEEAIGIRTETRDWADRRTGGDRDSGVSPGSSDFMMQETRVQLRGDAYGELGEGHLRLDLVSNGLDGGSVETALREGFVKFTTLGDHVDFRIGRQPATWGTGDLLFINDLFAKDYESFFLGREQSYLKAPSDAVRARIFGLPAEIDVVYTPSFTPDRLPQADRFAGGIDPAAVSEPGQEFADGEFALRLRRSFGSTSAALYAYGGRWKSPRRFRFVDDGAGGARLGALEYPRLNAFGGSVRGPLASLGIAWVEAGYYDTRPDADEERTPAGKSFLVLPNSEWRALAGLERTSGDLTLGGQFYLEQRIDHEDSLRRYERHGPAAQGLLGEETRTLVTIRADRRLRDETVLLSGFLFVSPSDEDVYVRISGDYDLSDELSVTAGANIFAGDAGTLFGDQDENDNLWFRVRLGF